MENSNDYITKQFNQYLDNMESSPLKTYIVERVIEQIAWYDQKSQKKQTSFKRFTVANIILNAIIPIVVLFSDYGVFVKALVTGLSSSAAAINAIVALCGYKDLWIQYRSNCELLKSILHRFFLKSGEFRHIAEDQSALMDALVVNCEEYFTKEFQTWVVVTSGERQPDIPKCFSQNGNVF